MKKILRVVLFYKQDHCIHFLRTYISHQRNLVWVLCPSVHHSLGCRGYIVVFGGVVSPSTVDESLFGWLKFTWGWTYCYLIQLQNYGTTRYLFHIASYYAYFALIIAYEMYVMTLTIIGKLNILQSCVKIGVNMEIPDDISFVIEFVDYQCTWKNVILWIIIIKPWTYSFPTLDVTSYSEIEMSIWSVCHFDIVLVLLMLWYQLLKVIFVDLITPPFLSFLRKVAIQSWSKRSVAPYEERIVDTSEPNITCSGKDLCCCVWTDVNGKFEMQ